MDFYRATEADKIHIKYENSIVHNTALLAEEAGDVVAVLEYEILNMTEAKIINFSIEAGIDKCCTLKGLIDELNRWNPYVKKLYFSMETDIELKEVLIKLGFIESNLLVYSFEKSIQIFKVSLKDIIPEQLSVDKTKLEKAQQWVKTPEDVIVNCVRIDDKIVSIDGHTRLVLALNMGFSYVYGYIEEVSEENLTFYKTCKSWCEEAGIYSIKDLSNGVVSTEEHQRIWIDRCQNYFKGAEINA